MKAEKVFTYGSIITFFALFPALIIMQVRLIREVESNITYLFIIADILLLAFMGLEIFLIVRKRKKEKLTASTEIEDTEDKVEIKKEWDTSEEEKEEEPNNGR